MDFYACEICKNIVDFDDCIICSVCNKKYCEYCFGLSNQYCKNCNSKIVGE